MARKKKTENNFRGILGSNVVVTKGPIIVHKNGIIRIRHRSK